MEPVQEVSKSQEVSSQQQTTQPPQASRLLHKKDEITPKIGQRESYKSYDNTPFDPYEKSKLYQEDYINNRVEERMRMQEKAAEKMEQGISNKDKFITRKGQEQFYFYGKMENFHIKKTKEKYDELQKKNAGYKVTKEQEDKYFKNYVDNAKPTSLDEIDREMYEDEGRRINKQQQYNKALNEQINSNRAMDLKVIITKDQLILKKSKMKNIKNKKNAKKIKELKIKMIF